MVACPVGGYLIGGFLIGGCPMGGCPWELSACLAGMPATEPFVPYIHFPSVNIVSHTNTRMSSIPTSWNINAFPFTS